VFGWLRAAFEARPPRPPAEFRHPDLGLLLGEEGLWSGRARRHGRDIPFVIGGTEAAPDSRLVDRLPGLLVEFPALEAAALRLLCPPDPPVPVQPGDFTFQSVDLFLPDNPDCFTFEFALDRDPGAIWRVEFHDGRPKYTGRDS
jgi:hypothetical protein